MMHQLSGRDVSDDIYAPFVYTEKAPMSTCNHLLSRDVARAYEKFKYQEALLVNDNPQGNSVLSRHTRYDPPYTEGYPVFQRTGSCQHNHSKPVAAYDQSFLIACLEEEAYELKTRIKKERDFFIMLLVIVAVVVIM